MSQYNDASDIPDAIAIRIGRFMAKCSGIDIVLQAIIWRLARLSHQEGRLLTGRLDARPKVEIIDSLMDLRQPEAAIFCSWKDISKSFPQLLEIRNWLAHGAWTITPLGEYALLGTRKKHKGPALPPADMRIFTSEELDDAQHLAGRTLERLQVFYWQLAETQS